MENVMEEAGSCGRFQLVQVMGIILTRIACIWGAFMMIYGNYNPGWRCRTSGHTNISSTSTSGLRGYLDLNPEFVWNNSMANVSMSSHAIPVPIDVNTNESSDVSISSGYNGKCDIIESCTRGIEFDPESSTIISEFGLVCDRDWIATVILIAASAGFVVGSAIAGQVSGRFGRKTGLYGCTFVVTVSSGAAIFSPNWQTYACLTFFMAMGSMGIFIVSFIFAAEFLNSKWRGLTVSRPIISFSLCVQSILMTVMKSWRQLHIATCVLSFIACCSYFVVYESPRWLFINSQTKKGEKIVNKIASRNGKRPIERDTMETFLDSLEKHEDEKKRSHSYTYFDLFRSRKYLALILKTSTLQTLNVIIYHAISFGLKSVPGNFYDNAIVAAFLQAGVLLSAGPVSNLTGRRRAGFLYSSLGSTSCFVIVISLFFAEGRAGEMAIRVSVYIAKAVTQAAIAANLLLTAESFPTAIRSVAIGFNTTVSSIGSFLFVFIIPKDDDNVSFAICYAVMAVGFFLNIFIFYSHSETNTQNLKDSMTTQARQCTVVDEPSDFEETESV